MANNIINAVFSSSTITYTKPAYQYDYGMILKFSGIELPQAYEVHFSNTEFCGESISQIGDESGVTIPDEMFLSGAPIYAWTYLHTGEDDGETVYKTVISINKRAQPSDIEPTPVQQDVITQAIAALNVAVEQTAADVVASGENAQAAADSAETAGQAKDDAVEAKDKAVEAKNAAETAQGKAEDAQRAAEQAAGSVLGLTADATVDANVGTPSVEVEVTTEADHKNMTFTFRNLKGVQGDTGVGISSVILNADYTLTINLTNGVSYTTSSIRGEVGATPNLTIGTISTLPEGSQATATITGTDEEPVLNLGIPVGDTGDPGISPTITVTEISGGHSVEVVDAQGTQTFDVMDGEVSEQDLEDALIDKADVITSSASGEIVTIDDGGDNLPVKDLTVSLLPVQDLHGQDAPYPPGGGKNLFPYPVSKDETVSDVRFVSDGNGKITITGTASQNDFCNFALVNSFVIPDGQSYKVCFLNSEAKGYVEFYNGSTKIDQWGMNAVNRASNYTLMSGSNCDSIRFLVSSGVTYNMTLQIMFVANSYATTTYIPYSNVCPVSGWTGVEVYHSDEDTSNPTTIPIDWTDEAGTVYGGSLDLTTGVLTVDKAFLDLNQLTWSKFGNLSGATTFALANGVIKNNADRRGELWCDRFKTVVSQYFNPSPDCTITNAWARGVNVNIRYDALASLTESQFKQWTIDNNLQICWGVDPTTYQLTPVQIATFLGNNSFWSNGNGVVDLGYRCDTKLYIEQLTKPSEDDMTANANIASGKFFMVGNRLMLSTTAIAQGEQIVVGTNCTEVSLADALNTINS